MTSSAGGDRPWWAPPRADTASAPSSPTPLQVERSRGFSQSRERGAKACLAYHNRCRCIITVLKLNSQPITHKSSIGGVQLNLFNAEAVRRDYRASEQSVLLFGAGGQQVELIRDRTLGLPLLTRPWRNG